MGIPFKNLRKMADLLLTEAVSQTALLFYEWSAIFLFLSVTVIAIFQQVRKKCIISMQKKYGPILACFGEVGHQLK